MTAPKWKWTLTVIVGAALGVLAGFVTSFGLGAPWPMLLQAVIAIAAAYGVNVITGPAFRNLFHLPPAALMFISMGLATVQISVPSWGVSQTAASIIQGVVALALALGFGTKVSAVASARSRGER